MELSLASNIIHWVPTVQSEMGNPISMMTELGWAYPEWVNNWGTLSLYFQYTNILLVSPLCASSQLREHQWPKRHLLILYDFPKSSERVGLSLQNFAQNYVSSNCTDISSPSCCLHPAKPQQIFSEIFWNVGPFLKSLCFKAAIVKINIFKRSLCIFAWFL